MTARSGRFRNLRRSLAGIRAAALVTAALLSAQLTGCDRQPGGTQEHAENFRRIVVLSPAVAEMLEALDGLDRVVGAGDFGPWPDALTGLPRVGGYDAPNVERLLELECDLVLTAHSEAATNAHMRLEDLGIQVEALDTSTYEGVFRSLRRLGEILHRDEAARSIEARLRDELNAVAAMTKGLGRRRVLVVVGRDPLYVAGPGSHVDEMIRLAGGSNVAHDALAPYQQVSLEVILERMPEVIIDASDNRPGSPRGRQSGKWGEWPFLPAVRDERVYWVDPGLLLIPGLRLPEMTLLAGRMIHPETFGEADAESMRLPRSGGRKEGRMR